MAAVTRKEAKEVATIRALFSKLAHTDENCAADLADALFHQGWLPAAGSSPHPSLLSVLNVTGEQFHTAVQEPAWNFVEMQLHFLMLRQHGYNYYFEKFQHATGASGFLNELLADSDAARSMAILNAIELAGYDVDDPQIIQDLLDEVPKVSCSAPAPQKMG